MILLPRKEIYVPLIIEQVPWKIILLFENVVDFYSSLPNEKTIGLMVFLTTLYWNSIKTLEIFRFLSGESNKRTAN